MAEANILFLSDASTFNFFNSVLLSMNIEHEKHKTKKMTWVPLIIVDRKEKMCRFLFYSTQELHL